MAEQLRQRPGDQPLPVPNAGPGMHDLLIHDLRAKRTSRWDRIADGVAARRDLGLQRYGALLQAGNGRDGLRDLYEEILDAMAYARLVRLEGDATRAPGADPDMLAREVEDILEHAAFCVAAMTERKGARHG